MIADSAGFCFGVARAVDSALKAREENPDKNIYTYGQLIHNPQEIERLEKKGIKPISSLKEINKGILIIRSHGVSDKVIENAKIAGLEVIDLTCPFVKTVHTISKDLEKKGYQIIIFGEPKHPEVTGIVDNLKKPIVIEKEDQISNLPFFKKIGFVSQTTQDKEQFNDLANLLKPKCNHLIVKNTICNATEKRQDSSKDIAKKVDVMLVIGGKNSGNTKRLYDICRSINKKTFLIETSKDLSKEWIDFENIGITAGASTPQRIIDDVISKIKELD